MSLTSNDVDYLERLEASRSTLLDRLLIASALTSAPILAIVFYFGFENGWGFITLTQIVALCMVMLLALLKHLDSSLRRTTAVLFLFSVAAAAEVFRSGLDSPTFSFLVTLSVLMSAVGGVRYGMAMLGACVSILIAAAWFTVVNEPMLQAGSSDASSSVINWGDQIFSVAAASGIGIFVVGALHGFFASAIDSLNERNRELARSQWHHAESTKLANLGHAMMDMKTGQFVECDTTFAEMHGRTVADFVTLDTSVALVATLIHEEDREAALDVRRRLLLGESVVSELRYRMPDGNTRYLRKAFSEPNLAGQLVGFCQVICQEVTEARLAQNKLFQAQKMDAIGNLTGGVAHDFNNLLAVILGNLELLDEKVSETEQKTLIQNGIRATLSGSELTRNMLSFAQRAPLAPTCLDLNNLTRNLNTWIGRTLPSTIEVETSLLAGLWSMEVDASSTESALLNLILNARDAMPEGGRLTIETSNIRIDEEYPRRRDEDIPPGRYVLLAVSDTGVGISSENLEKIFEPFFSTKPTGAGSGLGLPMLKGFMKQSGGFVRVYSEAGSGTTFKLYFVAAKDSRVEERSNFPAVATSFDKTRVKILLVEDNPDVVAVIHQILEAAGFSVIVSMSGDDALKTFDRMPNIDLLLTDIVMKGELQGTTLAKAIRERRSELPVVFMSGYAREATVHGNGLLQEDIRLMKPVGRTELLHAIDKALARAM